VQSTRTKNSPFCQEQPRKKTQENQRGLGGFHDDKNMQNKGLGQEYLLKFRMTVYSFVILGLTQNLRLFKKKVYVIHHA